MARVVGIDLGTTNSVVAYMENGHPVIIPNAEGGRLTPSVVAFLDNGNRLVGQLAKRQALANPERTVFSIKRRMGRRASCGLEDSGMNSHPLVRINGLKYTPEEISAMILRKIKTDAEGYLGETIEKAVITVPAYFNDTQRKATKDAGTIAGLDVIRIVNEPTAAALAYGLDRQNVHTVLVWDLGGGTFDVSILELGDGVFEVKAVNGDTRLGGDDYDQRMSDYLADEFQSECGVDLRQDPIAWQHLKEAAEQAKIELSNHLTTTIRLASVTNGGNGSRWMERTLTRATFEALTEDLKQRMVGPTLQALTDANLVPEDIDRVILVGGATRMPAVQTLIQTLTGRVPYRRLNPDEVVALGAAIQAGILTGEVREVVLVDVNPLSLGIETMGGILTKLIPRNTPIPTSQSQIFTTACDNQMAVDVHVLQGERELATENISLGQFRLSDIEPQPRGMPQIEVTFEIDTDSLVHVSAVDLQTENRQEIEIASLGRLSPEEVERMVQNARIHAEEDQRQRREIETGIRANGMICAAEYVIRGLGEDQERVEKEAAPFVTCLVDEVQSGISQLRTALAMADSEAIESGTEMLRRTVEELERTAKSKRQHEVLSW